MMTDLLPGLIAASVCAGKAPQMRQARHGVEHGHCTRDRSGESDNEWSKCRYLKATMATTSLNWLGLSTAEESIHGKRQKFG